jgi:aspartate aminotransferase
MVIGRRPTSQGNYNMEALITMIAYSKQIDNILKLIAPINRFFMESTWMQRAGDPDISDFMLGNPHERPLPDFTTALQKWSRPQNKDWYAYKENEPTSQAIIAGSLRQQRGLPFEAEDIFLTNGAFAALSVTLTTVVDPGDEVIFISPPWFFYESLIATAGARPVRVKCNPETFDLDLKAIEAAISERTRGIIINSPHNPTGKIYPAETLTNLAELLTAASQRNGRDIYLLSDEAYCRIIYDGRRYLSPTAYYPHSFVLYTYGKTLLTPGQRLGYIALPPTMPHRAQLREALYTAQIVTGFVFPNALLQHALPDLEKLSIDVDHLQYKRDWLVGALREMGYELHTPEGTFYLLVRSPLADDLAFINLLADYDIFCLPGTIVEMPGYFRVSLTANTEMIERALPGFAAAREKTIYRPSVVKV